MSDVVTMTIGGESVAGEGTIPVVNPALGAPFAEAPRATAAHLDLAVSAAQKAQPGWAADPAARREALQAAAALVRGSVKELAHTLTQEQGKPFKQAMGELLFGAEILDYYGRLEIEPELLHEGDRTRVELRRRPMGVVGAITPWNYPVMLALQKVGPALAAGNTMVLKPSPYTPLTTLRLGALLQEVLPAGVLNVISGGDELGAMLVEHPVPRKISFTGSVRTGKLVAASAGADLKRTTLELGGNDPAILLDDVDIDRIAKRIFWSAFLNSGQTCAAVKRVYVPRSRYDDVVEAVGAVASGMTLGNGMDKETDLGPLNNRPQLDIVSSMVDEAVASGARVVTGGTRPDVPGYFYEPTIVAEAQHGTRLVDEEQFGPALPLIAYDTVEEALERANGTNFGLGASVWSADGDRAAELALRVDAGVVWVNTHLALAEWQPFGGSKWSGVGVENGLEGYRAYTDIQVIRREG